MRPAAALTLLTLVPSCVFRRAQPSSYGAPQGQQQYGQQQSYGAPQSQQGGAASSYYGGQQGGQQS